MTGPSSLKSEDIRNYLLRRLPDKDLDRIEAAYFTDDSLFDRIEAEEDRMIAEYVMGQMPPPDRRRFEDSLLAAPYYRERVETTRRIQLQLSKKGPRKSPAPGAVSERLFPGRTGAIVLSGLGGLLLISAVVSAIYLRTQVSSLRQQVQEMSASAQKAPPLLAVSSAIPVQPAVPEGPGLVRLPKDRRASIQLNLPGRLLSPSPGRRFIEAVDASGKTVSRVEADTPVPEGRSLSLTLNPALLSSLPLEIQLVTEQASGRVRVPLARLEDEAAAVPPSP